MEDDNGLELSLGLSFGGSSAKPKLKNDGSSDARTEEVDRSGKIVDDFKNFLNGSSQIPDSNIGNKKSDSERPQENFFNDLSKAKQEDASAKINERGIWITKDTPPVEIEGNKLLEVGKRKMPFDDFNHKKKQEREIHHADSHDRARPSHISITEDGSTAENEDVADSEVENSSSKPISNHDGGSKRFTGHCGPAEVRGSTDPKVAETNAQMLFNNSLGNEFKTGNINYSPSFSAQSVNVLNMPYPVSVKESSSVVTSTTSVHPIPGIMQVMPVSNDRSGIQPVRNGNLPATFGYSPVQLPMFDKDNSWGLISHHQQFQHAGRGPTSSVAMQVIPNRLSEGKPHDGRPVEQGKVVDVKQHNTEEGSFSLAEDAKGSSTNFRTKDISEKSSAEGSSLDFSAIKPGIAADVKFGGCGSYPNLPWVSTTGSGPNARTISGVTYRYSPNQIRIVCACHGSHMSPEDFIRHASEENASAESGVV